MKHNRLISIGILASPLLVGCAGMLNKGKSTITLNSDPPGAAVSVNGRELGTAPYLYTYVPDDGAEVTFELRHPGHRNGSLTLHPQKAGGVLFLDAMLFNIPYIVDGKSPHLYRIPVQEHTVVLRKEFPAEQTRYLIPVTRMEIGMGDRQPLGTLGSKQLRDIKGGPSRELQYPDQLLHSVVNGMKGSWMDAKSIRPGTQKGDETIARAKMQLVMKLNGMRATLTGDEARCSGPVEIDMEWKLLSDVNKDSVLHATTSTVTYHAFQERASEVLGHALEMAAARFSELEELPARVAALYGSGLMATKGEALTLQHPAPIAFAGRKDMLSALVKAVVTIVTDDGHGSGFLITNDGYMITNQHVVEGSSLVKVKFEQGFTLDAQVLKTNKDFDLALLKVQATDLPALTIGDDAGLMLGEELFAIGTPLDDKLGQSVSRGILSGRRELDGRTFLQTDVSINPGNSGGPVVDENGKVVGVATMKISGQGLEGLGFAVPMSVVAQMLNITFR